MEGFQAEYQNQKKIKIMKNITEQNIISEVQISYHLENSTGVSISSSNEAFKVLQSVWNEHISYKESFYVLLLNRANIVLGYNLLSIGGGTGTVVDIKHLLQLALKTNASGVIVAHNHPSGNLKPSRQDKTLTKKVKQASGLLDIQLLDHLIITETGYFSFADELEL
jgi:DNA repair protein RadC